MKYDVYQVCSFTNKIFKGNPACVVPLKKWLPDKTLQYIAKENAVAETAFFIFKDNYIDLRWFTPDIEIDLCGHATLATAFVIKSVLKYPNEEILMKTMSGDLRVSNLDDMYYLDFPSRPAISSSLPKEIKDSLNIQPAEVLKSRDYLLIYENEKQIKDIIINRQEFDKINLGFGGVIVSSKSNYVDFVSRFFTPQASILEDPVTGSSHCTLVPYWSKVLNKNKMAAKQLSSRGGDLICKFKNDRVLIGGRAILYSKGFFFI